MAIPTFAQTVELFVPKHGRTVAINITDEAFYRAAYGALSPAEYAAQQVAAANTAVSPAPGSASTPPASGTTPREDAPTGDTTGEKPSDADSQVKSGKPFKSKAEKAADASTAP